MVQVFGCLQPLWEGGLDGVPSSLLWPDPYPLAVTGTWEVSRWDTLPSNLALPFKLSLKKKKSDSATSQYIPKTTESKRRKISICTPVFLASSTIAKQRSKPSIHPQMMNRETKCANVVHTHYGIFSSLNKEGSPDTCYNVDGSLWHEIRQSQHQRCCRIMFA